MVENGVFPTCFFDSAAKSSIRTADSKREFFDTRPRADALGLVSKKLYVFRPWYEITISPQGGRFFRMGGAEW